MRCGALRSNQTVVTNYNSANWRSYIYEDTQNNRMENKGDYVVEQLPTPTFSDEVLKIIIDRSLIPETLIHTLKGEFWVVRDTPSGKAGKWEARGKCLMNEAGILFFSSFIYSAMTPDKITTNITEQEVRALCREMGLTVVRILQEKYLEFNIDVSDLTMIVTLFDHYYFMNLTASRNGTLLKSLLRQYERREVYTPQKENKGGFKFPGLNLFGGGSSG